MGRSDVGSFTLMTEASYIRSNVKFELSILKYIIMLSFIKIEKELNILIIV